MTEPRHAYIASTTSTHEIEMIFDFYLPDRQGRFILYLDPSEAIGAEIRALGLDSENWTNVCLYQVDLSQLDGVWPRVSGAYNDHRLRWICEYWGRIPSEALKWMNTITTAPENAKIPPTKKADGEEGLT
jgi:hypothetical protein